MHYTNMTTETLPLKMDRKMRGERFINTGVLSLLPPLLPPMMLLRTREGKG